MHDNKKRSAADIFLIWASSNLVLGLTVIT